MEQYEPIIQEAARQFRIDPELIRRMIQQESAGRSNALSSAGAQGLMQLMPDTAKEMGVRNILDPRENIVGGTKYLRKLMDKYGEQDLPKVLAAYNAGPGNVDKYGGVPPFKETQDYHTRILAGYKAPVPEFPSDTSDPLGANRPGPVAQTIASAQTPENPTMPQTYDFEVTDPKTGRKYIMNGEAEPSDAEIDEYISQFERENPAEAAVPEVDKFKEGVLEQSQAAQAVQDPGALWQGLKSGVMASGGDPIKMMAQMALGEGQASLGRANEELEGITSENDKDPLTRWSKVAQSLIAGIPIVGELVKPMRESIPTDPQQPIDIERAGGNLVGAGVDAALARFMPEAGMAGVAATGRGMTRAGGAMAQNASNRLARNAELGPVTGKEFFRDIIGKRGMSTLAATAVNPALGAAVGTVAGASELAKVAGRSNPLARLQQRVGRALMPDSSPDIWNGPVPEGMNPALLSDDALGPKFQPEVRDPQLVDPEVTGAAYVEPARTIDDLWENVESKPGGMQDDLGDFTPESLEPPPTRVPLPEELWEDIPLDEQPVRGMQDLNEPVRQELPEIKGKEGKRILGEDQNKVSRFAKKKSGDDEVLQDLDPLDNKDIDLDEPEIVSRGNKLVDTNAPPKERPKVEVEDKTIPFADLEPGNRVKTANGKEGTLESFDEKSVVVKWDSGTRSRIARKAVEKVETKGEGTRPKATEEEIHAAKVHPLEDEVKIPHPSGRGFIKLIPDPKNPTFLNVEDIWVYPRARGQGIATELYNQALKKAEAQGLEGIVSYSKHRNPHSDKRWNRLLKEGLAEKLDDKGTYILRKDKPLKKAESSLEAAAREAAESIDEPLGNIDPFTKEPIRGHRATNRPKVEPQYPEAQKRLPVYKKSGEPTPRSELTNTRMTGENPRALGLNDRAIRSSKVGWQVDDKIIRKELSEGRKHVFVNIDQVLEAAKKDINRLGRVDQRKLVEAENFLKSKSKGTEVYTPEIEVKQGRIIISDGYHRLAAAKKFGEKSAPVRIPLSQLNLLKELGIQFRDLTPK